MRIFVDCTQTLACGVRQGIPRVVRSLVRHGRPAARERGVELVPVRFERGCFRVVPVVHGDELPASHPGSGSWLGRAGRRIGRAVVPRRIRRAVASAAARVRPDPHDAARFRHGDVLLLPDSSWETPLWEAVDRARGLGTALGVVQHDFIPFTHPHVVPERTVRAFHGWARDSLTRADFVLAVSRTVADQTRRFLRGLGRPFIADRCVTPFRNGADLHPAVGRGGIRPHLRALCGDPRRRLFLTVGTIEPRKNQAVLLDAIDGLLAAVPEAVLLLVGSVGWRGKPILGGFRAHPAWNRAIFHCEDLDDFELRHAYRSSTALVFPSLAEGYGLPIVEALACGTRVVASDLAVHREHAREPWARDACVFFDPTDPVRLAGLLIAEAVRDGGDARTGRFEPPTWDDAARLIVAEAMRHAAGAPAGHDAGVPPQAAVTLRRRAA